MPVIFSPASSNSGKVTQPRSADLSQDAKARGGTIYDALEEILSGLSADTAYATAERHVQPDFHGNRAPLADPLRKGAISGLSLEVGTADLARDYLATIQALAYGTRHVLEEMRSRGVPVTTMVVSGGLAKNRLFLREMSDATNCTVIVPEQSEPVLLGAAMLGAVASGGAETLEAAMAAMSGGGKAILPRGGEVAAYHERKYRVFRRMQDDFTAYAEIMGKLEEKQ